ncbi:hypothetical protein GQX74_002796 [Glossina fuscipes]|nr:hypothetical protein GQX74_002796 [Glossina fuscipes]
MDDIFKKIMLMNSNMGAETGAEMSLAGAATAGATYRVGIALKGAAARGAGARGAANPGDNKRPAAADCDSREHLIASRPTTWAFIVTSCAFKEKKIRKNVTALVNVHKTGKMPSRRFG